MTTSTRFFHRLAPVLGVSLLSSACILATGPLDEDDDNDDVATSDGWDDEATSTTGDDGDDATGGTSGVDDDGTTGESTGGEEPGLICGDNLVQDPGFEAELEETPWEHASNVFGTPLCDESCAADGGVTPYAGEHFVWFGGTDEADEAYVLQEVTFDESQAARLAFYLAIDASAATGDDVFRVWVDEELVFEATDADVDSYDDYTRVELDVSAFADGQPHLVAFESILAEGELTNFFLDEVEVSACEDDGATGGDDGATGDTEGATGADDGSTSGGTTGGETGTAGEEAGTTGDETGTTGG